MYFIDLFAGAGGLSEGFIRAGFEPIAHVESDRAACNTLRTRAAYHGLKDDYGKEYIKYLKGQISRNELWSLAGDEVISSVIEKTIGPKTNSEIFEQIDSLRRDRQPDLILGGPPCQAYSLPGRSRDQNNMKGDSRNWLYQDYVKFLKRYQPKIFVFENVRGLLSAGKKKLYLRKMTKAFYKAGYNMDFQLFDASEYGVLQQRKRILIIGWRHNFKFDFPDVKKVIHRYKIGVIFKDLPKIQAGEGVDKNGRYVKTKSKYLEQYEIRNGMSVLTQHIARPHSEQDKEIYRIAIEKLHNGQNLKYNELDSHLQTHKNTTSFLDRFKVVDGNSKASQTIVAHISKDGHHFIHPDIEQNRSLSVREAARLQSFPDDFFFEGVRETHRRTPAFKQIGNAVPPQMAYQVASSLAKSLQNH